MVGEDDECRVGGGAGVVDGVEDLADPAVGVGDGGLGDVGPGPPACIPQSVTGS